MPRRGRHGWLPLGLAALIAGCSPVPDARFPEWVGQQLPYAPNPQSSNAFDGYLIAANEAEKAAGELADYSSFEGKHKRLLIERLAPAVRRLRDSSRFSCDFRFRSFPPTEANPSYSGLRLIRHSLTWQIEAAVKEGNLGRAIELATLATKVGFDLSHGGASDADVGLQFADEARRAIATSLPDMSASQLAALTQGMKRALAAFPEFDAIAENEKQSFLHAVQWIQDQYRAGKFAEIDDLLGSSVRDATTYLKGLKKEDRSERPNYFEGFADEAGRFAAWHQAQSNLPVVKRAPHKDLKLVSERPWRRYSAALFSSLKPIQSRHDATLARTRLLILTSEIYRQTKVSGIAPKTLDAFSPDLIRDPYSGQPFKYRASGIEFYLYSVGLNFQDDQGVTDSEFLSPDLTIESNRR